MQDESTLEGQVPQEKKKTKTKSVRPRGRGAFVDLAGQVFGDWTVISAASAGVYGRSRWTCDCTCGIQKIVLSASLTKGRTLSCGKRSAMHRTKGRGRQAVSLLGRVFGDLTVAQPAEPTTSGKARWKCDCICGGSIVAIGTGLTSETTVSCSNKSDLHSHTRTVSDRRLLYNVWHGIKDRCNNRECEGYANYGGRGIAICKRWMSFQNFMDDMGPRPTKLHSIDRRNNDGNYEPSNCYWATRTQQNRNTRRTLVFNIDGIDRRLCDLIEESSIPESAIRRRLCLGWPIEKALSHPLRVR